MAKNTRPLPFAFPASSQEIQSRRISILVRLLVIDQGFKQSPVASIGVGTLQELLRLYDETFLDGFLRRAYGSLTVTLSTRMTSTAGKFIYSRTRGRQLERAEIRMSGDFLFRLKDGPFSLNGLSASTAQEAFLIVFEHELCHALELALFGETGHSKRFLALASRLFGHTDIRHSLPTAMSEARSTGVRPGAKVAFIYSREQLMGVVSSLGKRAAVMVPDRNGEYRDRLGRRYMKYYVPYDRLTLL
ncbi:MAG: hypothetical protein J6K32_09625 [Clostridia bacterium]|nr:hypothetical protein [Clostridia bacterium]